MSDTPPHDANPDPLGANSTASGGDDTLAPSGLSMMITRRQRAALAALGFTEAEIHSMRPAEAHAHLGLAP